MLNTYVFLYLLVSSRTDVYPQWFTTGLELVGDRHVMAEQAISRHFHSDHAGQYRSGVQSDSHLKIDEGDYQIVVSLKPLTGRDSELQMSIHIYVFSWYDKVSK